MYIDSSKATESFTIPSTAVNIISRAFVNCKSLKFINLDNKIETIGSSAFSDCTALTNVSFAGDVNFIGSNAFSGCTALEEITLPEGLTTISSNMFYNCIKLNKVNFSSTISTINSSAFEGCTGLTYISLPDSIKSLGDGIFKNCSNLKKTCLPEGTLSWIPANTFSRCERLTAIYIPINISYIGNSAFSGCNLLSDIYFGGTQEQWKKMSIGSSNSVIWAATVHCNHKHTATEWDIILPVQKYVDGLKISHCSECGYEMRRTIPCNHVHTYDYAITTPASCFTAGIGTYTCKCGDSYTETISSIGHTFTSKAVTNGNLASGANCHKKARYFYKCENCDVYSDTITFEYGKFAANNHAGGTENRGAINADCGNAGYTGDTYCLGCNARIATGTIILPSDNHTWNTGDITLQATCCSKGLKVFICIICNKAKIDDTDTNANNHNGEIEIRNTVTASCNKEGYTGDKYCLGCNVLLQKGEVVAMLAHNIDVIPGKPATCTEKGLTDGKKCSVCGEILEAQREISKKPHTPSDWIVKTEAKIGVKGEEIKKCTVCGLELERREIPAIEKPTESTTKPTEPTEKPTDPVADFLLGDVNGDGYVKANDARTALRAAAKLEELDERALKAADLDANGKVTAAEARKILRFAAKLDKKLK